MNLWTYGKGIEKGKKRMNSMGVFYVSLGFLALRRSPCAQAFAVLSDTQILGRTRTLQADSSASTARERISMVCFQQNHLRRQLASSFQCRHFLLVSSGESETGPGKGIRMSVATEDSTVSLLRPPARGPTLHVYLFVTIVGWGKNTLLDEMLPSLRGKAGKEACPTWHLGGASDAADEQILPGLFEGPELQAPTILESDAIGAKNFWPAVQEAVMRSDDETVYHLFLNKNFPPNAWLGARKKLLEYCKTANRAPIIYAVVPRRSICPPDSQHLCLTLSTTSLTLSLRLLYHPLPLY